MDDNLAHKQLHFIQIPLKSTLTACKTTALKMADNLSIESLVHNQLESAWLVSHQEFLYSHEGYKISVQNVSFCPEGHQADRAVPR